MLQKSETKENILPQSEAKIDFTVEVSKNSFVIIQKTQVELIIHKFLSTFKDLNNNWSLPLGVFLAMAIPLVTTKEFRDIKFLSPETLTAFFVLSSFISGIWLLVAIYNRFWRRSKIFQSDYLFNELIDSRENKNDL